MYNDIYICTKAPYIHRHRHIDRTPEYNNNNNNNMTGIKLMYQKYDLSIGTVLLMNLSYFHLTAWPLG